VILLDSHIVLSALGLVDISLTPAMRRQMSDHENIYVSVVSIWELAIKHRLKKLGLAVPPDQLADLLERLNIEVLPILATHTVSNIGPEPSTKDPFDRLLLGVCAVEGMSLLTLDEKLIDHPLAWRDNGSDLQQ
jgi:PIN domain nuclease of toxin-antitoxin system